MRLSHTTPIGLDIGTRCVKAVQLVEARGGRKVLAAACIDRTEPGRDLTAAEAGGIRAVLDRQGFVGTRVIVSSPTSRLLSSVLELPPRSSGAPLESITRVELARANGCAADAIELSWWELPSGTRAVEGTHVFAVGLRHADAEGMLDSLESAGFLPEALDSGLLALARVRGASVCSMGQEGRITGLMDLGATGATIAVLHGSTLVYQRTLAESGLGKLHRRLVEALRIEEDIAAFIVRRIGLGQELTEEQRSWELLEDARAVIGDYAEAIGAELKASLGYAARRYGGSGTDGVLASGGGAGIPGVLARVEAAAESSVQAMAPTACAAEPGDAMGAALAMDPRLACAAGLAIYGPVAQQVEGVAA